MSALLLYGVVLPPGDVGPPLSPGVAGAVLRLITQRAAPLPSAQPSTQSRSPAPREPNEPPQPDLFCAALVSPLLDRQLLKQPSLAEVLAFQRAISVWHQHAAVLPARFGCLVRDEDALRSHLRARQSDYLDALQRIVGCVEMGVRVTLPAPRPSMSAPDRTSGASFLRARQQHYARLESVDEHAAQIAGRLTSALAPHARQSLTLPPKREEQALAVRVAFLVERSELPAFRAALAALAPEPAGRRTLLGPWPPFSFAPIASPDGADEVALGVDPP